MHPQPELIHFEVRRNGRVIPLGVNSTSQSPHKVPPARAALAAAVAGGWFVREQRSSFVFARHYAGVDALLAYYRERDPDLTLDEDLIVRARALLVEGAGTLVSRAGVHAERLRRTEPHGLAEGRQQ